MTLEPRPTPHSNSEQLRSAPAASAPAVSAPAGTIVADDHLTRLLAADEEPFYKTFIQNLKDTFFPEKLPPLEVTSKPVPVKDIWGRDENKGVSAATSLLVHAGIIGLMLIVGGQKVMEQIAPKHDVVYIDPGVFKPQMPVKKQTSGGGGGGGAKAPTPPAKGQLPKFSPKPFIPPKQVLENPQPKLTLEAAINVPPDIKLPKVDINQFGNPNDALRAPSNGSGSGDGIGSGSGGGIGSGKGNGLGPGEGGGTGGGVFRAGGGVSNPQPIFRPDPEYSEEARKAKYQGIVTLSMVVDEQGRATNIKVVKALGLGLDEKAIEGVSKWRFKPGMKNGQPVKVAVTVEVNFRLM